MQSPVAAMMTYAEWIYLKDVPLSKKIMSAINYYRFRFCLTKAHKNEVNVGVLPHVSPLWFWIWPLACIMHQVDLIKVNKHE
jgi:hypothetical protein